MTNIIQFTTPKDIALQCVENAIKQNIVRDIEHVEWPENTKVPMIIHSLEMIIWEMKNEFMQNGTVELGKPGNLTWLNNAVLSLTDLCNDIINNG